MDYRSATRLFALFLLAALLAPAPARAQQAAATAAPAVAPGDIYLQSSRVYALVGKSGFGHEHGVVGMLKSGKLHLGAAQNAGDIVFDMATFTADAEPARKYVGLEGTSSESTQQQVTDNMRSAQVLNVAKFPTAKFVVKSAQAMSQPSKRGLPQYLLKGDFTLQSATRPLEFPVEVEMAKGWQHARGGFRIKQTDFGMTPFSKAFGAIGVADEISIWGDVWVAPDAGSGG
ncbi:hypothetical protein Pla123a_30410 [Posidoniimonas polymericola]|uniref:Lipid/polyisoprenoid-binding YceI-like domain-containing protein n=1 Tax=Posidoniimonas polymericola TaxID=2528002 RepID=A0A5C5YL03_9BACT|nr:YceI family protein [Posidoniimonas polymericola]TWT75531.1 hypothetical protein Pla123a_30410 [Posidoniimonas polymericola]